MAPRHHQNQCGTVMEFSLETSVYRPQYQCGSCSVHGAKARPELLSLFPSAPVLVDSSTTQEALQSFVHHDGLQQLSEKDSGEDVFSPSEGELTSQNVRAGRHDTNLGLSTFRASKRVAEKTTAQKPLKPVKKPRQKASLPSSKTNGSGSVPSSAAPVQRVTRSTRRSTQSKQATSGGGQDDENRPANKGRRHGPRPKSSPYRGVTFYKRTGRWEAHIWNRGRQIYLGASSGSERAARAYDRAAIHFRHKDAVLNFFLHDYEREIKLLMEISDAQVVKMLRKQSAGISKLYPVYPSRDPPAPEQPHTPIAIEVPSPSRKKRTQARTKARTKARTQARTQEEPPSISVVETIPPLGQVHQQSLRFCTSSVDTMARTMVQPQEPAVVKPTLYAPKARHVSQLAGEYLQIIDNMIADMSLKMSTF